MKKVITFISGDLRLIFRDRMLSIFLFAPLLLIAFVRLFVPFLTDIYPVVEAYHPYIMMFASMQVAVLFGFITAFMILDEKDEQVISVIRVLPVSASFFISWRLSFATFFSALSAFMMISLGGIAYPGLWITILLSLQYGLVAPLIALIVGTFPNNKIEGMAYFKGVNLLLILPVISFFVTGIYKYVFAFVPIFWTYLLYHSALTNEKTALLFIIGMGVYLIVLSLLFMQFQKRVFAR